MFDISIDQNISKSFKIESTLFILFVLPPMMLGPGVGLSLYWHERWIAI